jgi:cullin 1
MAGISQYPMPPHTADLATTWGFLEEGVDHIMTKLQTGVSPTRYMSLYTAAYNFCTSSRVPSNTSKPPVAGRCLSLTFRLLRTDVSLQPVLI